MLSPFASKRKKYEVLLEKSMVLKICATVRPSVQNASNIHTIITVKVRICVCLFLRYACKYYLITTTKIILW